MNYTIPVSQKLRKLVRLLHQKQHREQNNLFIAEGYKLCNELLTSGFTTELIILKESPSSDILDLMNQFLDKGVPIYSSPKHQFDQMSDSKTPQGIIAVVSIKENKVDSNENVLILDGVSDPGNIGTIIRTAEWFGYKNIIASSDTVDYLNPKAVRSTMGSIYRMNIEYVDSISDYVKKNLKNHSIYGANLKAKKHLDSYEIKGKHAIVFGSEAHGISDEVNKIVKNNYRIKGYGEADSLNVAVSVGVSLYHFSKSN